MKIEFPHKFISPCNIWAVNVAKTAGQLVLKGKQKLVFFSACQEMKVISYL